MVKLRYTFLSQHYVNFFNLKANRFMCLHWHIDGTVSHLSVSCSIIVMIQTHCSILSSLIRPFSVKTFLHLAFM